MDSVDSVRNLDIYFPNVTSTFSVYADPVFFSFDDGKRVYKGEALILDVRSVSTYSLKLKYFLANLLSEVHIIYLLHLFLRVTI